MAPPKEVYDQASEVACYYRVYSSYGGNARTAVRALRRRMPARTPSECETAFQRALLLIDRCKTIVDADRRSTPAQPIRRRKNVPVDWETLFDVSHLVSSARQGFPEFSERTVESVLQFVLYYYHLR